MSTRFLSCFFDRIRFILAGNKDMHKSSEEDDFWPDPTKKIDVTSFSRLLLICSFSNLQVMRTCIISWMSLNFRHIGPPTTELAAFERRNKSHRLITTDHVFLAVFDRIIFILAGNEDIHKSLDEFGFRPDPTTDYGVSCL